MKVICTKHEKKTNLDDSGDDGVVVRKVDLQVVVDALPECHAPLDDLVDQVSSRDVKAELARSSDGACEDGLVLLTMQTRLAH